MARSYLNSTDATNQILSLGTIGSYVLYRTGSHIAWNKRKVLGTIESHLDTLCHHIIEHLTTATRQAIAFATNALASGVNHNAFEIAGEEKIASSTYYNIRRRGVAQNRCYLKSFLLVGILQETGTLRLNTKGIVWQQTIVLTILHDVIGLLGGQLGQQPFAILTLKGHFQFLSVGYATQDKKLGVRFLLSVAIDDVINHLGG